MTNPAQKLRDSADAVARLGCSAAEIETLTDDEIVEAERLIAQHRRALDTYSVWVAGQLSHRSRRELGYSGLALSRGFTTPEALIQSLSGSTRVEASKHVRVGALLASVASPEPDAGHSWLTPVAEAIADGRLGIDSAESIRRGLGAPDAAVAESDLHAAAEALVLVSADADQMYRLARRVRDELDSEGVSAREAARHEQRYFRIRRLPDGGVDGSFRLGSEQGEYLISVVDSLTSPRRGGPRFVDPAKKAATEELLGDPRTTEQLTADGIIELLQIAADADPAIMLASGPCVRVIVTEKSLHERRGYGRIEGHHDTLGLDTIDRLACDSGILGIKFDAHGKGINVGRDQRLFTGVQRAVLAVRDGGCRWPGCDRPPSWAEAHHINQWVRDRGRTDLDDGILLCRRHHMLLHNNRWRVIRTGATYWLEPPAAVDADQKLIAMPSRTPEIAALQVAAQQTPSVALQKIDELQRA